MTSSNNKVKLEPSPDKNNINDGDDVYGIMSMRSDSMLDMS